jgi:K+-sensing histidine kinase KdpD
MLYLFFRIALTIPLIVSNPFNKLFFNINFNIPAATLGCSRTTSNLRYCNPYAIASSAGVYVRKVKSKTRKSTKSTKSTTKTTGSTKKLLVAKKFAPVLRKTNTG